MAGFTPEETRANGADVKKLIQYSFELGRGGFQERAKTAADSGTG